jgi:hypothetical protein
LTPLEKLRFVAGRVIAREVNHARFCDGFKNFGFRDVYTVPDARIG